ncbi:hypothetical protein HOY80DRAFT_1000474 [Tuber brumale]|nr:hypothetical protein HOY80DRAFT_1000474 [Tuber brumale]
MSSATPPPGPTDGYLEWGQAHGLQLDDPEPEPEETPLTILLRDIRRLREPGEALSTEAPMGPGRAGQLTEPGRTEPSTEPLSTEQPTEPLRTEQPTETGRTEPGAGEFHAPVPPSVGMPDTPCDFTWSRFRRSLSEWQAGLEALYAPFSNEAWTVCTTEEWLYRLLHDRLVTRFARLEIVPTEQEAKEIHVICMLAKYYLIMRDEREYAHLPIYLELALSDAIIQLTVGEIDFTD